MKLYKLLVLSLSVLLAGGMAQADETTVPVRMVEQDLSFMISSHNGLDRIYYNCDSVEAAAEDMLAAMGAYDVKARCSGGIGSGSISPEAFLHVSFVAPATVEKSSDATHQARYVATQLDGRESNGNVSRGHSCHLAQEIFRNSDQAFELQNVEARFSCSGFSRSYKIEFSALKL